MGATTLHPLSNHLISLHGKEGYQYSQYFQWMVDDCLAGFGVPIPKNRQPPQAVIPILFDLGKRYAQAVNDAQPFEDILGRVYMDLVSQYGQKAMGQYFTPWPVAYMMAKMLYVEPEHTGQLITACDPAVGSGVMMLAFAANVADTQGLTALKTYSFTGIDLDPLCARIFPLQMFANALIHQFQYGEILAYHGNALGDPNDLDVICHATNRDLSREVVPPAKHPARLQKIANSIQPPENDDLPRIEPQQMTLF